MQLKALIYPPRAVVFTGRFAANFTLNIKGGSQTKIPRISDRFQEQNYVDTWDKAIIEGVFLSQPLTQ